MSDQFTVDGIFDAKLIRENKSAKGIFLTLEIAADDYFAAKLSDVRPGALLKIGYQEIVDVSVQPIEVATKKHEFVLGVHDVNNSTPGPGAYEGPPPAKPKKRFEDYPLSAQCAMVCDEPSFHRFLELYLGVPYGPITSSAAAATAVRSECRVTSRAELDKFPEAANAWRELYRHYQAYITDSKYAAVRR